MKALVFILLSIPIFLFSNCKKDIVGCTDPIALNYNSDANVNTGCEYSTSTFIFYASGDSIFGESIDSLKLYAQDSQFPATLPPEEYIGTIKTLNQNSPDNCSDTLYFTYTISDDETKYWSARIFLTSGNSNGGVQSQMTPSASNSCVKVDVLPF